MQKELNNFKESLTLVDRLSSKATKEQLIECARLLAINVAHYESQYGALPLDEVLEMSNTQKPNEAQLKLLTHGMQTFITVLEGVVQNPTQKIGH